MGLNVAQKLISSHLAAGEMTAGTEIGLRIDQTLTQDATGTMVMLELEALGLDRVRTQVSVLLAGALRGHEAAALMVEEWNHAARCTYAGLGMRYRPLAAAAYPADAA